MRSQATNKNDLKTLLDDIDTLIPTKSPSTTTPTPRTESDSTTPGNGPVQTSSPHIGHTDTKLAPRRFSPYILFSSPLLSFSPFTSLFQRSFSAFYSQQTGNLILQYALMLLILISLQRYLSLTLALTHTHSPLLTHTRSHLTLTSRSPTHIGNSNIRKSHSNRHANAHSWRGRKQTEYCTEI
jgi:hypothetical protein